MATEMRRVPLGSVRPAIARNMSRAQAFADATAAHGGASMNARTGQMYNPGDDVHMVGAHKGYNGKPIPTTYHDTGSEHPHLTAAKVHRERLRVLGATGGDRNVGLGSWVDEQHPQKGVQVDASTVFKSKEQAKTATVARNEDAMFSMKDMSETRNEDIRNERQMGKRPPRG